MLKVFNYAKSPKEKEEGNLQSQISDKLLEENNKVLKKTSDKHISSVVISDISHNLFIYSKFTSNCVFNLIFSF